MPVHMDCQKLLSSCFLAVGIFGTAHVSAAPSAGNPERAPIAREARISTEETTFDAGSELLPAQAPIGAAHVFHVEPVSGFKYVTYLAQNIGPWSPKVVHWRYNDTGRNSSIGGASSAAEVLLSIQAAQAKWSAVCNVQFVYDGTSTFAPTPNSMFTGHDGISVVGWAPQTAPQTGVTGVYAVGVSAPYPIVESDMLLNNAYNPDLALTLVHEFGHMIGINHSDVSGAVMSGPPLTAYSAIGTLQADDVAACQSLYGLPPAASIGGTITAGASPLAGVRFCAAPAAGVSCSASALDGSYNCTVPVGWTGRLHSRMVTGWRIPAQAFNGVTTAVTRNVVATSGIPSCDLDVDDNGLFEPATDGAAIMQRLLGLPAAAFSGLAGNCAANTSGSAIYNAVDTSYVAGGYNVVGGSATLPLLDGAVIVRAMNGQTGVNASNGLGLTGKPGALRTSWATIQPWLNSNCRASF